MALNRRSNNKQKVVAQTREGFNRGVFDSASPYAHCMAAAKMKKRRQDIINKFGRDSIAQAMAGKDATVKMCSSSGMIVLSDWRELDPLDYREEKVAQNA